MYHVPATCDPSSETTVRGTCIDDIFLLKSFNIRQMTGWRQISLNYVIEEERGIWEAEIRHDKGETAVSRIRYNKRFGSQMAMYKDLIKPPDHSAPISQLNASYLPIPPPAPPLMAHQGPCRPRRP